ncbi:MAG: NAD-dependent deacylase [Planctomycetota bacterium]|nr:MAG: NAD-dependent deacylase [Planctomycetota bacterium]
MHAETKTAANLLRAAQRVCVSTGAGVSAESGVPTFRDAQTGYWSKFRPEDLATPEAFARDPQTVWAWYRQRRAQLRTIEPHAGHRVLAEWERRFEQFTLITQNVDGLHHRAGSQNVIELHGRLDVARCTSCSRELVGLDDLGADPRCESCGERLRPGVVWFGEMLPPGALEAAYEAAAGCEVFLVIGTSGVVQPAASLADDAKLHGARIIEINPNATPLSPLADVCVRAPCGEALPAIDAALRRSS